MNKSINYELILQKINDLESNISKSRNIVKADINYNININKINKNNKINIKEYKIQEEYGEKKFIKP